MALGRPAFGASLAVGLVVCVAGCGVSGGIRVEGPAPTRLHWSGPVYALDWESKPRQEPDTMDLSGDTTADSMRWHGWGSPRATATGYVTDYACLSGCLGPRPPQYEIRIVLSHLVRRQYAAYYSHAAVTPVRPPVPYWAEKVNSVSLHVPAS